MRHKKTDDVSAWVAFGLFAVVALAWALCGYLLWDWDNERRGSFGDMFGAVNALFSGWAFVGVILAILLQRRELQLQRKELKLTRKEFKEQTAALTAQNTTFQKQSFEATFFQLLALLNEIVAGIDLVGRRDITTKGRDCFRVFYDRLKTERDPGPPENGESRSDQLNRIYLAFYNKHEGEIGHYFRTLYNIVKFVDHSDIQDKRLYTNLVRAQLSSYELLLLFYNAISEKGREKFKPLIEKYALLKTLPQDQLLSARHEKSLYARGAYGLPADEATAG